jgi:hypothetical protein
VTRSGRRHLAGHPTPTNPPFLPVGRVWDSHIHLSRVSQEELSLFDERVRLARRDASSAVGQGDVTADQPERGPARPFWSADGDRCRHLSVSTRKLLTEPTRANSARVPSSRCHAARAALPSPCIDDDASALGAEQPSRAVAERGLRGRSQTRSRRARFCGPSEPRQSPDAGRRRQATAPCRCLRTARRLERLVAPVGKAAGVGLRSVARDGVALKGALTCGRESRSRERGVSSVFAQFGFGSTACGVPGEWGSLLSGANVDRHLSGPR